MTESVKRIYLRFRESYLQKLDDVSSQRGLTIHDLIYQAIDHQIRLQKRQQKDTPKLKHLV